ncbi:SIMPL domain-containing protein [Patescibacteria group bacterium]|nr:SIMPL domain-containing protein [Patescibacteria group bacterium]
MDEKPMFSGAHSLIKAGIITLALLGLFLVAETVSVIKDWEFIGQGITPQTTIAVSGHGEIFAVPDIAVITFDVREEGKTPAEAQTKASTKMNAVLDSLKKFNLDPKDVKTIGYNIYPKYESRPISETQTAPAGAYSGIAMIYPPTKQVVVGYEASQSIQLKVRKVDDASMILGTLGGENVSNISGISFSIDDPDTVNAEAREKAIADAKSKASVLAKELNVSLVRIVSFYENNNTPVYFDKAMGMGAAASAPSVAPQIPAGSNKVTSDVSITYEIN